LVVSLGKGFKRCVDHGEAGLVSGLIGSVVQGPNHRAVIALPVMPSDHVLAKRGLAKRGHP